jgi:hypothetical protein
MVAFTTRCQRSGEILTQPVGVFEDDGLLLRLAARSRPAESACLRGSGPIDADDLAFENGRLADCETWDL